MTDTTDLETKLSTALSLFVDGQFDDAYYEVLDVVEVSPGDPDLWQLLGTIALRGSRPLHAYQAFSRQRELRDDERARFSQLLAAYYAIDVTACRTHAEEALARFPDSVEARSWATKMEHIDDEHDLRIDVGRSLCRQGRYLDSIDYFIDAIEARDTPAARLWLGRAFLALGEVDNAIPLLESAASEMPDDPTIGVDVATAYSMGERDDIAHAWLAEAQRVHPDAAEVHEAIARLALDEGDIATASRAADAAVTSAPDRAGAWMVAAGVFEATGDLESARIAIDRSLALDPSDPGGWTLGARIVRNDGDAALGSCYEAMAARLAQAPPVEVEDPGPAEPELARLDRYVEADPAQARAYRDRATINRLLGLPDRASRYEEAADR